MSTLIKLLKATALGAVLLVIYLFAFPFTIAAFFILIAYAGLEYESSRGK